MDHSLHLPMSSLSVEDDPKPRVSQLGPTIISGLQRNLSITGTTLRRLPQVHPVGTSLADTSPEHVSPASYPIQSTDPASALIQPPPYSSVILPKKEEFYPEDKELHRLQSVDVYDTLIEQCGSGRSFDLRKAASIRRLLPTCAVYTDILDYISNSCADKKVSVKTIYKIQRYSDNSSPLQETYRILLWHGTSPESIPSIIETGFRKGKKGMFGGGTYFADRVAKALIYTTKNPTSGSGFLVLAEVYPGAVYKAHHFHTNYKKAPKGYDSVKGNGADIPTWKENRDYFGAIMPCGQTRFNPRHPSYDMKYNEYILYNMDRVIVRFIVECTF